jgi:hypothetical protein
MKARILRIARRTLAGALLAAIAYVALLVHPDPLFAHTLSGGPIVVHADAPIPDAMRGTLRLAEAKVRRSPIYDPARVHHVYVCQTAWRWRLLSNWSSNAAGIAYAPIGRSVFLRRASLEDNTMIGPSGRRITDGRTLDYYVAHEVTHTITADLLGARGYYALPVWAREGYADYVGRGAAFDYDDARGGLLRGERVLSPKQSGHYLRYALFVAHLLDREGWTVERLLREPPDERALEARVRAGTNAHP